MYMPMKRKKRTEIVVERDQVIIIRNLQGRETRWCEACGNHSRMVSVDEAAAIVRASSRAIYRSAEDGKTHSIETAEGRLLICLTSLFDSF
jgi:hypothetical protein